MPQEDNYLGFIKYDGASVKHGYLDARKSAEALLGLDEAVRFFVGKQAPDLKRVDYELPIRIRKGSWEALIPHDIQTWATTVVGLYASSYAVAAATKMAENDVGDIGLRTIFKRSLQAIQWVIRIGKHLGSLTKRSFAHVEWRKGNTEIGIPNNAGEILFVPTGFYKLYEQIPVSLLSKLTSVIEEDRELIVGVSEGDHDDIVSVDYAYKGIFCPSVEEVLFPELTHGLHVELDGLVTRGNENANSIGFQYDGHILTCYPSDGSIVRFKPELFILCRIIGTVTRADKLGTSTELRPKIIFSNLIPLETEPIPQKTPGLFDDEVTS